MIDLPLWYIKKHDTGGGMFHTHRIELTLDEQRLNQSYPPFIAETWTKICKEDIKNLQYRRFIANLNFNIKKFTNKDARDKCLDLLKESMNQ